MFITPCPRNAMLFCVPPPAKEDVPHVLLIHVCAAKEERHKNKEKKKKARTTWTSFPAAARHQYWSRTGLVSFLLLFFFFFLFLCTPLVACLVYRVHGSRKATSNCLLLMRAGEDPGGESIVKREYILFRISGSNVWWSTHTCHSCRALK